jgi:1-acyl-sn-glycerol-3-phosphate acyltransferase
MSRQYTPKAGFWIRFCVVLIYPLVGLLFRVRFRNLDRMPDPAGGGVIIAINHVSQIDTLVMARCVWQSGRVPRFMIKATVFGWPVVGAIVRGAGQIPVNRGTTNAAESLHAAAEALRRGEAVVIYPEGTTTKDPDNWPMAAKTGIARLVLLSPDTPVVPIGQWGAQYRRKFELSRLFRRRVALASLGKPLDMTAHRDTEASAESLRAITDTIMTAVRDEVAGLRGETAPAAFFTPPRVYVDKR